MSEIKSFSKIFTVGSQYIPNLFVGEVEITEKVDGSQFSFGWTKEGKLVFRSKGKEMSFENYEKLFNHAVEYLRDVLPLTSLGLAPVWDTYFYCEYLQKPKHNTLSYKNVPKNHLVLYGIAEGDKFVGEWFRLRDYADALQI